jgi:hypothetical protein
MRDILPEMPELTFDDARHTYRLDGIIIPSVSTIMEPLSNAKYKGISESTLSRAADKGTGVHNAIENWTKYGIEDILEEHRPYFDAFLQWWEETKPEVVGSECRVYHKLMRYGGTIDLLAYIDGKLTLVDYKTTYKVSDMTCGVQLEAYAQACASHGIKVERKRILHLTKKGEFEYRPYPDMDPERWRVFGALKTVYDYLQET